MCSETDILNMNRVVTIGAMARSSKRVKVSIQQWFQQGSNYGGDGARQWWPLVSTSTLKLINVCLREQSVIGMNANCVVRDIVCV